MRKDTFNREMRSWSECEIVEVKVLGTITENTLSDEMEVV